MGHTAIEASLNYLRDGDDALATLLIGGVLLLASPLLIPAFAVFGYVVRVLRRTADGDDGPPVFDARGELLADGLRAFVVTFVYSLLPLGVVAVAAVLGLGAFVARPGGEFVGAGTVAVGLIVPVGGLVALLVSLVGTYLTPAAVAAAAVLGWTWADVRPVTERSSESDPSKRPAV